MGGWGNISIWVKGTPLDKWLCPFSRRAHPVELVFRHLATQSSRPFCPVSTSPLSWNVRQFSLLKNMEILEKLQFVCYHNKKAKSTIGCIYFNVTLENIAFIWRRHHYLCCVQQSERPRTFADWTIENDVRAIVQSANIRGRTLCWTEHGKGLGILGFCSSLMAKNKNSLCVVVHEVFACSYGNTTRIRNLFVPHTSATLGPEIIVNNNNDGDVIDKLHDLTTKSFVVTKMHLGSGEIYFVLWPLWELLFLFFIKYVNS